MERKRPPIPLVVVVLLVLAIAIYLGVRFLLSSPPQSLAASGTIEAVEITISSELSGKVTEVYVDEGDSVHAGDVLFRLDDTLLQAQRRVAVANLNLAKAAAATAQAALDTAQANYDLALDSARLEAASTRTALWRAAMPSDYDLPGWYFPREEEIAAAQREVETARAELEAKQQDLHRLLNDPRSAAFVAAEERLLRARVAFLAAQGVLEKAKNAYDNQELRDSAQTVYDDAKEELQKAQEAYDDLADRDIAKDILSARADLAAAQECYEMAQDHLLSLQIGAHSPKLAVAKATLEQARAALKQAEQAVEQARANLTLIDAQIAKLTVTAPTDGVILTRSIQPGEVLSPGGIALILARLDELTITVYVPEDRYGQLSLGQEANVHVDSFPDETFKAVIVYISNQAEFTPRNVQTVEGRSSTVYAVRLRVEDPQGKLKAGMPADVTFTP